MGRSRRARAALVAAFSVAAPAAAQTPPAATPSPAAGTPAPGPPAATPPAAGAAGTKTPSTPPALGAVAPDKGSTDASAPPKPSAPVGGYSWTDKKKPARAAGRRKRAAPAQRLDPNAPLATYPGFRMLPNGESQLVLRVTKPVDVQVRRAGGSLVFVLPGVRVGIRNNTNPLITTHFNTPLSMARLVPQKQGAELVVELRESVQPKHKVTRGPYGTLELEVLLPRAKRDYASAADPGAGNAKAAASGTVQGATGRGARRRGPEM